MLLLRCLRRSAIERTYNEPLFSAIPSELLRFLLPFPQLHLIDFDVIPLTPFTGLSRLEQAASEERAGQRSQ
ncbi:MAG TPA: hypothetical protein VEL31_28705 [Ktedonobacteraceae bacterium]|nr:hypothetical protein [Ktedonobacteraceae bacterium]